MPLPLIDQISESELKLVYRWLMCNGFQYCQICGARDDLTFDHIIPKIRGGGNSLDNLCILCATCNVAKGSRMMNLIPLTVEKPELEFMQVYDLREGMYTFYGKVEATGFVGHFNNKDMYVIEFSGIDLMSTVMTHQKLKRRLNRKGVQSRPGEQKIPLDPRYVLV